MKTTTDICFGVISTFLVVLLAQVQAQPGNFDITKFGGKADSDISMAFMAAYKEACAATSASTIVIPKGNYQLNPVIIEGPCKAPVTIQVQGTVKSPEDRKAFPNGQEWITIKYISGLTITGGGILDGNADAAWKDCVPKKNCGDLPYSLSLNFINNTVIQDITSLNSKLWHVNMLECRNVTFQRFNLTAPGDSLNTDGIHIARSEMVNVTDSVIATGDDCISIGDGAVNIYITNVTCGPGHGISIGSLGKSPGEEPVKGIHVKNCTFKNTLNGARIKTWGDSNPGEVSDVYYEDIILQNVSNPIIIDQNYCPAKNCQGKPPSKVKLSNLNFNNIKGSSATGAVVQLGCSSGVPCENVTVGEYDISYSGPDGAAKSVCVNVKPKLTGKQNPAACTETTMPASA